MYVNNTFMFLPEILFTFRKLGKILYVDDNIHESSASGYDSNSIVKFRKKASDFKFTS